MRTNRDATPECLHEVWQWKAAVAEETRGMSHAEAIAYFHKGLEDAADSIGAALHKNPDGTYSFVSR